MPVRVLRPRVAVVVASTLVLALLPLLGGAAAHADPGTTTVRASVSSGGQQLATASDSPAMSADGRYVAFRSGPGTTEDPGTIRVRDRAGLTTSVVATDQPGAPAVEPAISADGQVVTYTSAGPDPAVLADERARRPAGTAPQLVDEPLHALPGERDSRLSSPSGDGRAVALQSHLSTNSPDLDVRVDADAETDAPALDLNRSPLPFLPTDEGRVRRQVLLTNTSELPLDITGARLTGDTSAFAPLQPLGDACAPLAPGAVCSIEVDYPQPAARSKKVHLATLLTDSPELGGRTAVALVGLPLCDGFRQCGVSGLEPSGVGVTAGSAAVSAGQFTDVLIVNHSEGPQSIRSLTLAGTGAGSLTLVPAVGSDRDCRPAPQAPVRLIGGASCAVRIAYSGVDGPPLPAALLVNGSDTFVPLLAYTDLDVVAVRRDADGDGSFSGLADPPAEIVSRDAAGRATDGREPRLSADGTHVAFVSSARLVPEDTDDLDDVYVRDLVSGAVELASSRPDGTASDLPAEDPSLSDDGSRVAYDELPRYGSARTALPTDGERYLYLCTQTPDAALVGRRFSWTVSDEGGDAAADHPFRAACADPLVFEGDAELQVVQDEAEGVFVQGIQVAGDPTATVDPASGSATVHVGGPVVVVTFTNGLSPVPPVPHVFLRQTGAAGRTVAVDDGAPRGSTQPALSGDGSTVAFTSPDPLAGGPDEARTDVFSRDASSDLAGVPTPLSQVSTHLSPAPGGDSGAPVVSGDGRTIAFASTAGDLLPPGQDTNAVSDIYVATTSTPPVPVPGPALGGPPLVPFGQVLVGTTGAAVPVLITNIGTVAVTPSPGVLSGPQAGDVQVVLDGCSAQVLLPGASCTYDLALAPSQVGPSTAVLTVSPATGGTPAVVELGGLGTATPTLVVSPAVTRVNSVAFALGTGFPPDTTVVLSWTPGLGSQQVTTDSGGAFNAPVLVLRHDELGDRTLTARVPGGLPPLQSNPVLVVERSLQPPDFKGR